MKRILKHLAAVLLGLLIVNGFCAWYYNTAPYEHSADRATDTVRRPGSRVSQAKEGMGVHRIDANGYNDPKGEGPISVLMMGTSNLEGFNVSPEQNVARLLERALEARVYNIGMSDHPLYRNAANLDRALERFQPTDFVLIETPSVVFVRGQVERSMTDTLQRNADTRFPLPDLLVNQPLSKRLFKQFMNLVSQDGDEEVVDYGAIPDSLIAEYEESLTAWFTQLNETADRHGVKLVIWYHPHLIPGMDGTAAPDTPAACLAGFKSACDRAGVTFVDLTEAFLAAYEGERMLPDGFANTALGVGHMNADGHRLAAEVLAGVIEEARDAA